MLFTNTSSRARDSGLRSTACAMRLPIIETRPPLAELSMMTLKPCGSSFVPSFVGCIESLSGSEKMLLLSVMLSCGPQMLATSSSAQLNVQWSMTTFVTGTDVLPSSLSASRFSGSGPLRSSPGRTRRCCTSTFEPWILSPAPLIVMPGDGAVCPAIVIGPLRISRSSVSLM